MGQQQSSFQYAVPINKKEKGESQTYRHAKRTESLLSFPEDDKNLFNLQILFLRAVKLFGNNQFLGTKSKDGKKYIWRTYNEVFTISKAFGKGLIAKNLITKVNEFENYKLNLIGIFSKNREEWLMGEYANFLYNFTYVPFYDTLGPESISFILEQTNLETIIISETSLKSILSCQKKFKLKNLILLDVINEENTKKLQEQGLQLFNFWDLVNLGKQEKDIEFPQVSADDIFTFSYTSGTTGNPKGALLSHKNLVGIIASTHQKQQEFQFCEKDIYISYLPLPHVLERIFVSVIFWFGAKIGFYSGDVQKLKDDLKVLQPTIFVSVPRLFNKFYDGIKSEFNKKTGMSKYLIEKGLNSKMYYSDQNNTVTSLPYDTLVFNKTAALLGGKVRIIASGGAPLSGEVQRFLQATLCCTIQQGYGATESTGLSFNTSRVDPILNHVGGVSQCMEFKLVDCPELGYTSEDLDKDKNPLPRGEVCLRGTNVFPGYYKEPEKTKEAIDKDGWLHTGDIGEINYKTGGLRIIDRKKNLFKLAQGEYIAPDKIENVYATAKGVEEIFVHGDSLKEYLVGIVVPNKPFCQKWAKEKGLDEQQQQMESLCKNEELKKLILKNMVDTGKSQGLQGFEQVRVIHLEPQSFAVYNCLTTSFKLKRKETKDQFKQVIDDLYKIPLDKK